MASKEGAPEGSNKKQIGKRGGFDLDSLIDEFGLMDQDAGPQVTEEQTQRFLDKAREEGLIKPQAQEVETATEIEKNSNRKN